MVLHELLADDLRLASAFEEYLVCQVYIEVLEQESLRETSTLRSAVRTRLKTISREISHSAAARYPEFNPEDIGKAATLILERQPIGREFYISKLPDRSE